MINTPEISVIVPVYNVEKVLGRCIESILNQSFQDFELILIDDGSSDDSGSICDQYSLKDSRVCVFHQKNSGVSTARNRGLKEAKGEYIVFIDSDDWVENYFFDSISAYFNKYDIIGFGLQCISSDGNIKSELRTTKLDSNLQSLADIVYSLFKEGILGYMCSMAFRRKLITDNDIRFRVDLSIHEDSIFCYNCLLYAKNIITLDILPYVYINYTNGRQTLSKSFPSNYYKISMDKISAIKELFIKIEMPEKQSLSIMSDLKYWTYSACVDIACKERDQINAIKKMLFQLSSIGDFRAGCSVKRNILKLMIKSKNPYLILFSKRLSQLLGTICCSNHV
nr:glycosyltransferase family 2 protein [Parabacteroides goldsteinii]